MPKQSRHTTTPALVVVISYTTRRRFSVDTHTRTAAQCALGLIAARDAAAGLTNFFPVGVCTTKGAGMPMAANDPLPTDSIDFEGILRIDDICKLLQTSDETIRKRLNDNTFPIPPLPRRGIDNKLRWSGPVVRRWLDENGGTLPDEARGRR